MRRLFSLLVFLALLFSMTHAEANTPYTTFCDSAPAAGSLTGSEPACIIAGGVTKQTTTQAIANLAPGGSGTPGGNQYQVQAHGPSNTFIGLNDWFAVDAYGAKCDATIIYQGVHTTNGSPNITVPAASADGYAGYTFTAADVGKIVTISNPAQENTVTPPTTTIKTTILSISGSGAGNTAVLATNMTFTSTAYQYASVRMYKTDDATAIQAAYNAANANGGGTVYFPAGCAATGPITFYANTRTAGIDKGGSFLMLTNNSNSSLLVSNDFSSLIGTNSYGGVGQNAFEHLMLDGNKMANTGTSCGNPGAAGDGVQLYGHTFTTYDVLINYFPCEGWYSEWTTGAGSPAEAPNGMEANMHDLSLFNNGGYAIIYNGPHDSKISYLYMSGNAAGGLWNEEGNGSPLAVAHAHGYVNGASGTGYDFILSQPYFGCDDCDAEGGVEIEAPQIGFTNSGIGISTAELGLTFNCGSAGSYYNEFTNTTVSNITNLTSCDTGSDFWYNSGYTGTNTGYTSNPAVVVGGIIGGHFTHGLILNNAGGIEFATNPSWSVIINTSSNSDFTMDNGGGHVFWSTSGQALSLGPSAVTPQAGTHLDLHTMTDSMILPTGNTGARPGTGIAGMMRYNSSTPGVEAYYGTAWNDLAATSAFVAGGSSLTVASGCGTVTSVVGGSTVGGNVGGSFNAGATSCVPVLTLPTAPNGWDCVAKDLTTPADTFTQTAKSTTSCTLSGTVTSGDTVIVKANWY